MAMSRILSQSLLPRASLRPPASIISHHRHGSNKSHRAQLIEVDLDAASSTPEEVITIGIKNLGDAIHGMIVRRAAPDWLPFLPGYSYWVPPPRSSSVIRNLPASEAMIEAIGRLSSKPIDSLSDDEQMSCSSFKGWPSSSYFTEDTSPHPVPVMEVEVNIQENDENADNTSNSEDVEG